MEIKKVIYGALGYMYWYRKPLAKALIIPVLILVIIGAIPIQKNDVLITVILNFISLAIFTFVAINTHRIILLGESSVTEWGVYSPGKREFSFVWHYLLICLFFLPFALLFLIPYIGWAIGLAVCFYLMARFSLVFPAIATDKKWSFSDSWAATKNHQFLMVVVVSIFPVVISIPQEHLSRVPYVGYLANVLSAFTMVFVVAALSSAFQLITKENES